MSKKSTYRSIGREIEAQRMTHSSGFSETLTEKELRSRANSLLQKPSMVKVYKNKKDGGIIKPMKLVEQLRNTYLNNNTNNQVITNNELVQSQPIQQIQQQCFEIDFDWLDYCDESKFKQIFKDDLKDISDMEQYVEENQSYLCHIFGQCACAKCTCNKCICSYKKKQELIYSCGMMTNNRFDYIPKQIKCMTPIITQSHYDNLVLPNQWMQLNSTSRDNYKWIQKEKTKNLNKSMYEPNNLPTGQTINNVRFLYLIDLLTLVNWKEYNQLIFKAPQFRTTVKGNFGQNKTNYRNQFIWKIKDENQTSVDDIKQKQQHQTISKIFPIQMRSIYQDSFIPKYQKTHRVNVKPEEILPCQPFQGQYISTFQQDFEGKQPNQKIDKKIIKYSMIYQEKYFSPKANQEFFENFLRSPKQVKLYRIRFESSFNDYLNKKNENNQTMMYQHNAGDILKEQVQKRSQIHQRKLSSQYSPMRQTFQIPQSPRVRNIKRIILNGQRVRFQRLYTLQKT